MKKSNIIRNLLKNILFIPQSYLADHGELEFWTDNVPYSLSKRRRWLLPGKLHQLIREQDQLMQQEEYQLLLQICQDPDLYLESRDVPTTGNKLFYHSKAEQSVLKGKGIQVE